MRWDWEHTSLAVVLGRVGKSRTASVESQQLCPEQLRMAGRAQVSPWVSGLDTVECMAESVCRLCEMPRSGPEQCLDQGRPSLLSPLLFSRLVCVECHSGHGWCIRDDRWSVAEQEFIAASY